MHILFIFYEHVAYSNLNTDKNIIVLNRLQALGLDESYFVLFFSDVVAILQDHYNQTTQIPLDLIENFVKRFGLGDSSILNLKSYVVIFHIHMLRSFVMFRIVS